ncbi:helix-turn-helix transcriptional regulator [Sedimentitalea todarodis]|uniref:LuxR family transcriptional regulator n=1 Tax=Sedimentitalea todarodis TaxID=1631240 RepID=A0ABU3VI81_9RHOB|nr:LuxR family transcriptional regulator [Sedimentitalea todarodis]MDU9005865.1 LuxR family transcriptional regulator [Sedimentitalea todarodis]
MVNRVNLDQVLEELDATSALEELQGIIEALRDAFLVDHMVYHWVDSAGDQYGCGTYSNEWRERWVSQNYQRVDPVILGCFQRFHPVDWKRLDWSSKAARQFMIEAQEYGVGNQGFSIPIRGPNGQFALFSVSHSCDDATWAQFTEDNSRDLILIAHFFNRKALEFEPGRQPESSRALSPREVDAMTLLAMGYSRAQTAETLSISEHTLRVYIESARFKLGALNTTHAVARAMSRGLIVV